MHSRFIETIQASHPKVVAFVREIDKIWAAANKIAENDGRTTSKMVVELSPGEYQYTGKNQWSPLCHPFFTLF